jgi:hypothetical protein
MRLDFLTPQIKIFQVVLTNSDVGRFIQRLDIFGSPVQNQDFDAVYCQGPYRFFYLEPLAAKILLVRLSEELNISTFTTDRSTSIKRMMM